MARHFLRLLSATISAFVALSCGVLAAQLIVVPVDQSQLLRLPSDVSEIVLGNPAVAEVTALGPKLLVLTGKTHGVTNLIVRDAEAKIILDANLAVGPVDGPVVNLLEGTARTTYSCTPKCEQTLASHDAKEQFDVVLKQSSETTKQNPCDAPDDRAADGSRCGGRSAYDRPGGRKGRPPGTER